MSNGEGANSFLHALKARHTLVLKVTVAILLAAALVAFLTRQYSASAVVALNPNARSTPGTSAVEIAWTALTDQKISALIQHFQLNTELAGLRSHGQVFTYLRSNISFDPTQWPGSNSPQIVVSYTGEGRSSVVAVANAVAQILAGTTVRAETKAPAGEPASAVSVQPTGQAISEALQKSRANLQLLSQSQNGNISRSDVVAHLKTDVQLKAAQNEIMLQLAALQQQSGRDVRAISKARTPPPPPPPNPARLALQQQIKQAQARLNALRQRYTDEYPDVEDARAALAGLEAKLALLPAAKPRPQPSVNVAPLENELLTIAKQQDDLRAEESGIEQKIKTNAEQAEVLRQRLADQQTLAEDYAQEQQRYNSLLQLQQAQGQRALAPPVPVSPSNAGNTSVPLFIVVKSAATAEPLSIALKPLFWIATLGVALLAASFVALLAEQFDPLEVEEETRSHSLHTS